MVRPFRRRFRAFEQIAESFCASLPAGEDRRPVTPPEGDVAVCDRDTAVAFDAPKLHNKHYLYANHCFIAPLSPGLAER